MIGPYPDQITLPEDKSERLRMYRLLRRVDSVGLGRRLIDATVRDHVRDRRPLVFAFDRQMTAAGLCYMGNGTTIALDPAESDDLLASVLVHELRHSQQPRNQYGVAGDNHLVYALFHTRLIEADAFAMQALFAIDSRHDDIIDTTLDFIARNVAEEGRKRLLDGMTMMREARHDDDARRKAVAHFFWAVQDVRLHKYHTDIMAWVETLAEQDPTFFYQQAARPLEALCCEDVFNLQTIPDIIGQGEIGNYLDPNTLRLTETLYNKTAHILRDAQQAQAQARHYEKPASAYPPVVGRATLRPGRPRP